MKRIGGGARRDGVGRRMMEMKTIKKERHE
jgi:hypothetical protein